MKLKSLIEYIEKVLPSQTAMENDRIGLQIQSDRQDIDKVLIAFEVTDEVVKEAIEGDYNCIITFHPLIWQPLLTIESNNRVGYLVTQLIAHSIALISVHTTFDASLYGTSRLLLEHLDLKFDSFLVPDAYYKNAGMGVVGHFEMPIPYATFLQLLSNVCAAHIRYTNGSSEMIQKVAIVGGSGSDYIDAAIDAGADAFVTADCTYHQFHRVRNQLWLFDPGHYEMEQFVPRGLLKIIANTIPENDLRGCNFDISIAYTNPISYYPDPSNLRQRQIDFLTNK